MGSFDPVSLALTAATTAFGAMQQKQQKKAMSSAMQANANTQARQVRDQQEYDQQQRRAQLKKALATQRARMGAAGAGGTGGSGQAVLLGLTKQSLSEDARSKALADIRVQNINSRAQPSLLSASQNRQKLLMSTLSQPAGGGMMDMILNN